MAEQTGFQEFYLREIGVCTPLVTPVDRPEIQASGERPVVSVLQEENPKRQQASAAVTTGRATVSAATTLEEIALQAASCTACPLSEQRNSVVFGVGNPHAEIVFIGEAPGRDEDLKGEPFVGRAGQLLDRMLASLSLDRSQVYIMNTVKCRPPNNRDPKPDEVEACGKWFDAQLKALSPKLICLLGRVAAQTVLETDASLSAMRGRWHQFHGIPVRVVYHPAYLLRSPQQKRHAWSDLCALQQCYQELSS